MASNILPQDEMNSGAFSTAGGRSLVDQVLASFWTVLKTMASLKLTVTLFSLAIVLILVGTLAQARLDMWEVISTYFHSWGVLVPFQVFFPPAWFPDTQKVPGAFPFPGGLTIGWLMFFNLLSAHILKFKIQTQGARLWSGLAVIGVGLLFGAVVILGGHSAAGLQGEPVFSWKILWGVFQFALVALWGGAVFLLIVFERKRVIEQIGLGVFIAVLGGLLFWIFRQGADAYIGNSSMRILWQLTQGLLVGIILLAGCVLAFKKRAGIVVLHFGVGVMMLGELYVGNYNVEEQIELREGEISAHARDIRTVELAFVDTQKYDDHDDVVVIPREKLVKSLKTEQPIQHEDLPCQVQVLKYYRSSDIRRAEPEDKNLATKGRGTTLLAEKSRASAGADSGGKIDFAAVYVKLLSKDGSQNLGVYMFSQLLGYQNIAETIEIDGRPVELFLRFKRNYKPYSIKLNDVSRELYPGTTTPRSFSSNIHLVDLDRGIDFNADIWMNNPLRYAGETFYQSGYDPGEGGKEVTTLQVVKNFGWMVPYVGCGIVSVGMFFQFRMILLRFLNRRSIMPVVQHVVATAFVDQQEITLRDKDKEPEQRKLGGGYLVNHAFPTIIMLIFLAYFAGKARLPQSPKEGINYQLFGQLPVVYQGRVKPIDTLARNALKILSTRETYKDEEGKKQPAVRWFLDVISGSEEATSHKVFKITDFAVLSSLGLERRKGFLYSIDEFKENLGDFEEQVTLAREQEDAKRTRYHKKILELNRKLKIYLTMQVAFQPPRLPPLPSQEDLAQDREAAVAQLQRFRMALVASKQRLDSMSPPLVVPVSSSEVMADQPWLPYASAWTEAYIQTKVLNKDPEPTFSSWNAMIVAFSKEDQNIKEFNKEAANYRALLERERPHDLNVEKNDFEVYYNHLSPFYLAAFFYLIAFILGVISWLFGAFPGLGFRAPLSRASLWLVIFTVILHTFALGARMYISERPFVVVTNLYSSAIFIGWAGVIFGIVMEGIYRLGIGNVVASAAGFSTSIIAMYLAGDGDTFGVMQAVLDTNFWLATHVTCISLGYTTTFVAGLLGVVLIGALVLQRFMSSKDSLTSNTFFSDLVKNLARMIYGVVCFALFFSFVGTVLGGLWADESWGRFWGWDPKENGALIIVFWNALILHARWGAMVKERGLAMLAVGGNIVTAWSWFGVNELGVGLHSYGFTEGVLMVLGIFVLSQIAIIVVGGLVGGKKRPGAA